MTRKCNPCRYHIMNTDGVWYQLPYLGKYDKSPEKTLLARKSWKAYRRMVQKLTELQPLDQLENIDKRGFNDHHIDHKTSIWHGWKHGIPAEEIAHISNLRVIPCKENLLKGRACIN